MRALVVLLLVALPLLAVPSSAVGGLVSVAGPANAWWVASPAPPCLSSGAATMSVNLLVGSASFRYTPDPASGCVAMPHDFAAGSCIGSDPGPIACYEQTTFARFELQITSAEAGRAHFQYRFQNDALVYGTASGTGART